ncbi:hypothetical protein Tco_1538369 [Tanacetum coccineum]
MPLYTLICSLNFNVDGSLKLSSLSNGRGVSLNLESNTLPSWQHSENVGLIAMLPLLVLSSYHIWALQLRHSYDGGTRLWETAFGMVLASKHHEYCSVTLLVSTASDEELEELMKDQLLPADASPIALSPDYISDSDPEEDDEEDPEEDPADYPADGGDNDDNESSDDDNDDDDNKRQNTGRAYTAGHREKKHYGGSKPLSDCPELKNQNHENGGTGARGMVHALGGGKTNQDHNDMEEDINA